MKVYGVGNYDDILAIFSEREMAEVAVNEFMFGDYVEEYEVDECAHILKDGAKKYEVIMDKSGKLVMEVAQMYMSSAEKKDSFAFDVPRYGHRNVVYGVVFAKTKEDAVAATNRYRIEHIKIDCKFNGESNGDRT